MEVFKIKNNIGAMVVKVEAISHAEFGRLMAKIVNIIDECSKKYDEHGVPLDDIYRRIKGVSGEMIELAIEELIKDEEIYEHEMGGYRIL
jgi:DNA replicative helicase MCM subunit Mcm2 (Cdc46/Mcm family)